MSAEQLSAVRQSSESQRLRYRLLLDLTVLLARSARLDDVLDTMHLRLSELFAAPVTVVARSLPDGGWDCLTREGDALHHKLLPPQRDGLLERALRGDLTYTNDLEVYAEQEGLTLRRLDTDSKMPFTRSWLGVPLPGSGGPQGIVSIQSYAAGAFSSGDLEFLTAFAAHLGTALENAALRERLEREARTDELTGLGNRRSFGYAGARFLTRGEPFSVVALDLQGFKRINDEYGHAGGDRVLRQVAELLRQAAQPGGRAFRLGGDEFVLLLPGAEADNVSRLEALRAGVAALPWTMPVQLNLGLAVGGLDVGEQAVDGAGEAGGAHGAGDAETPEALIARLDALMRRADERMYDAKARGLFIGRDSGGGGAER